MRPAILGIVLALMAGLFVITGLLARTYRYQKRNLAERHFETGRKLAAEGRNREAVEEYRAALSFQQSDRRFALALALALFDLGNLNEAAAHLVELREADPNDATVNLLLARIAARQGRFDEAVNQYHRAIYGLWPQQSERKRLETRFELVEFLASRGDRNQVIAELLETAADAPGDSETKKRVANLLLRYGSASHAADLFQDVLKTTPGDAAAYRGVADAEFALGDYRAAQTAYRRALHWKRNDPEIERKLEETSRILALDPTLPNLSSRQRLRRTRQVMEETLLAMVQCTTHSGKAPSSDAVVAAEAVNKLLRSPAGLDDFPSDALTHTEQLWKARLDMCGPPSDAESALAAVLAKVAR